MIQPYFIMFIGVAGAGKSTLAQQFIDVGFVHISSDNIREELTGDIGNQDINGEVFNQMAIRTREALKNGENVIYDATNISRKKRKGLLQQLPKDVYKIACYFATEYDDIIRQNATRERIVPNHVIERMYKSLQIPVISEGWGDIAIYYNNATAKYANYYSETIKNMVLNDDKGYGLMRWLADEFDEFAGVYNLPQDSKYHSFSVSRHIYYVYKHVFDNYEGEDRELMLWTALLHDVGKAYCKSFKNRKGEDTRYANFIGHEYVGSQIAIPFLHKLGFDKLFIKEVATLIQFHMYLLDEKANKDKLREYVGDEMYAKLEFLRDADTLAH